MSDNISPYIIDTYIICNYNIIILSGIRIQHSLYYFGDTYIIIFILLFIKEITIQFPTTFRYVDQKYQ